MQKWIGKAIGFGVVAAGGFIATIIVIKLAIWIWRL